MKVNSVNVAWELAKMIFPTDYKLDLEASKNAGYEIYRSAVEGNDEWISDLGTALELNLKKGSIRINIEEEKPAVMTVTVKSLLKRFETYTIPNVVSVQYVTRQVILTSFNGCEATTQIFNSNDVIVEVNV